MTAVNEAEGPGIHEPGAELAFPSRPGTPGHNRESRRPGFKKAFASFSHRNYRLWFAGQLASLVGTWMQTTAQGFLIFELTHSPAFLGYVGFATGIPIWLFTLFGGIISDRMSRRDLLVITQSAMLALAFILAALTFLGVAQPWHIVVLAFGLGVANAFDAPARQAFVVEMVGREDLGNAIALNSTMFNLASATGPAIAGIAYAFAGPAWCFTINGLSFIPVIVALLMMRIEPQPRQSRARSAIADLKEGLRYVASHEIILVLTVAVAVANIFAMSFLTLFPAWSVNILGGDSLTNGLLQSARGVGAVIAAFGIASLGRIAFKGKLLTLGTLLLPAFLLAWSAVRWLPLSLALLIGTGLSMMLMLTMINVLVQSHVLDHLRGRVMGIHILAALGTIPIGALFVGEMAERIGEPATVAFGALVMLAFSGWLWFRLPHLRALE